MLRVYIFVDYLLSSQRSNPSLTCTGIQSIVFEVCSKNAPYLIYWYCNEGLFAQCFYALGQGNFDLTLSISMGMLEEEDVKYHCIHEMIEYTKSMTFAD